MMKKHSMDPKCDRIIRITYLLCTGKRVVQDDTAREFGVHKRTIYRDLLKIGEHFEVLQKRNGKKVLYYYSPQRNSKSKN